mmetsp:Transcript_23282/g.17698  ORF Transcript_23282/g.17698 Transcript_23282/m.17698 type:complete len:311 (+) Transcript_23282:2217-3149(+)|eukprot:CAMPEP_0202962188 /NCGR_PEP_ID=MMETSP1396-20130829/6288_1 /ASSEMBLY_ACC=CAM_ASM_000872 /TAXON_ID= /ORGANISM="Pseudokeronopsis sp., Strain Brazil" /LENGTH=310 /DNA_ID=CAMNT_0049682589 /DNA_START=2179 /DNA_END=3111 /DNA_ORIENTATION=+
MKREYKLLYGSQFFYIFFKQLYTIYERLIKARELVSAKVEEDLCSKAIDEQKQKQYKEERMDIFVGLVLATLNGSFDSNKYEDFARNLLGGRAYLLFSFEKLISQTVKQLLNLANDDSCQKSIYLYKRHQENLAFGDDGNASHEFYHNESIYLQQFQHKMLEVSNFNGVGIRLLYSPLSNILSIHYFNMNPYSLPDRKQYADLAYSIEGQMNQVIEERSLANRQAVFLQRNKQRLAERRSLHEFEMENNIIPIIQPQCFKITFEPETEDMLLHKRKSRLNVDEMFKMDQIRSLEFREVKRRRLDGGASED